MINTTILSVKRINIFFFFLLIELLFLLIIYKVFHVPITHDETATTELTHDYNYWQIMMNPNNNPNNHILNALFTKFFIWALGAKQWVVRLPNLHSFLVYAFAVFKINKTVLKTSSIFFIPATILFFWTWTIPELPWCSFTPLESRPFFQKNFLSVNAFINSIGDPRSHLRL